jgi:hypothetical protein
MSSTFPRTCVTPQGFRFAIHKPSYTAFNLRQDDFVQSLGKLNGQSIDNSRNFPAASVNVEQGDWIYEIPNPLPFRGATYITKSWGDAKAQNPADIKIPKPPAASMRTYLKKWGRDSHSQGDLSAMFQDLPHPVLLALAANSTDPEDLTILAQLCCEFSYSQTGKPTGLIYQKDDKGRIKAKIPIFDIFEILVNNEYLPAAYKEVMVLRPGAQGDSEIVGDENRGTHVFEYLRQNSYIAGGHYAANMANDAIRYHIKDLSEADMHGLRHIYYQRTYVRLAQMLNLKMPPARQALSEKELEDLRLKITAKLPQTDHGQELTATLWGWNYGYDCSADNYRLHASHQMIHNQFAMLPGELETIGGPPLEAYGCGDLISDFMRQYQAAAGSCFFDDYYQAILNNKRIDGRQDLPNELIVHQDENVILFVPKAQTSQWELQLMPTKSVGNIVEADSQTRKSINRAILTAMQMLTGLGAKMITVIEYSKRLTGADPGQRLLYSFLPKLPESMGAFSEAQLRWINGHYPEDFARALKLMLS